MTPCRILRLAVADSGEFLIKHLFFSHRHAATTVSRTDQAKRVQNRSCAFLDVDDLDLQVLAQSKFPPLGTYAGLLCGAHWDIRTSGTMLVYPNRTGLELHGDFERLLRFAPDGCTEPKGGFVCPPYGLS